MANDEGQAYVHPIANPVDRFEHLPIDTRRFLERLDEEDLATLIDLIRSYQRAATIGWFFKWLIVAMVGTFMAAVSFGESIKTVYNWVRGI